MCTFLLLLLPNSHEIASNIAANKFTIWVLLCVCIASLLPHWYQDIAYGILQWGLTKIGVVIQFMFVEHQVASSVVPIGHCIIFCSSSTKSLHAQQFQHDVKICNASHWLTSIIVSLLSDIFVVWCGLVWRAVDGEVLIREITRKWNVIVNVGSSVIWPGSEVGPRSDIEMSFRDQFGDSKDIFA